jgi:hypothetical protein
VGLRLLAAIVVGSRPTTCARSSPPSRRWIASSACMLAARAWTDPRDTRPDHPRDELWRRIKRYV